MTRPVPSTGTIRLPAPLESQLIRPEDPSYSRWRSTYTRTFRPGGVLIPEDAATVAHALSAVQDESYPLSIRSGGHGMAGRSSNNGGLVIDLSQLNGIEVLNRDRPLVRIGAGARWGTVAQRLATEGWAISSGDHGNVGLGGLATGGGVGWLARSYGLTIDNIVAADLVTVDGRQLHVSADQEPEIFWALRGAGAGLGAVVSFDIEAMPLEQVGIARLGYRVDSDGRTLSAWASALAESPRELSAMAMLMAHGDDLILDVTAVIGPGSEPMIREALDPLLGAGPTHANAQLAPYSALVSSAHEHPNIGQQQVTSTTAVLPPVDEETARALVQTAMSAQRPALQFRSLDAAVTDPDSSDTAFAHRAHQLLVVGMTGGADADEALATAWQPLAAHSEGAYPGFESRLDPAAFARAYPGQTGERVQRAWEHLDPQGRLRPMPPK